MLIASPSGTGSIWGSMGAHAAQRAAAPSAELSAQERDVLAQERALKASAAGGTARTTYIYATGADGARYIVGAEVTITGPEEVADGVPGGGKSVAGQSREPLGQASAAKQGDAREEQIGELERIQREVVAHETAHKAAAGRFGGPVRYTYTTGPDGKRYITGGEVPISTPATNDPQEALRNARQVMRAAMAPGDPSGQDVSVAANAAATAASAYAELARENAGDKTARGRQLDAYEKSASANGLWCARNGADTASEGAKETFEIAA